MINLFEKQKSVIYKQIAELTLQINELRKQEFQYLIGKCVEITRENAILYAQINEIMFKGNDIIFYGVWILLSKYGEKDETSYPYVNAVIPMDKDDFYYNIAKVINIDEFIYKYTELAYIIRNWMEGSAK